MSNIQTTSIDPNFPVAGQDNDSQGFRDNFNDIKIGLTVAKDEITTLETTTAKLNANNDFDSNELQNAVLHRITDKYISKAATVSTTVQWSTGTYQKITITNDLTLTLDLWPAPNKKAKVTVQIIGDGENSYTVTWASTQGNNIKVPASFPKIDSQLKFTIATASNPKIFEFWTTDGGDTVFGNYLGEFI